MSDDLDILRRARGRVLAASSADPMPWINGHGNRSKTDGSELRGANTHEAWSCSGCVRAYAPRDDQPLRFEWFPVLTQTVRDALVAVLNEEISLIRARADDRQSPAILDLARRILDEGVKR